MNPDYILKELEDRPSKKVHFIGVGGIGMSSLARWFLAQNWLVSGSDSQGTELTEELQKEGLTLVLGHKKGLAGQADLVIRSQAILPVNPEYMDALAHKRPIYTYPEMIGALTRRYDTLSVAGAHGKSTTTALLALVAVAGKMDPTVIIGTKLKEFAGRNFRKGRRAWLVLESDEYGRAFVNYSPFSAIITNIDREHLDTYGDLSEIKKTFLEFISRIREGGSLVLNKENKNLFSLEKKINKIATDHRLKIYWYSTKDPAAKKIQKILRIPGVHNLSNATAVYMMARKVLRIPEATILRSLSNFKGSWRRYEHKGSYKLGAVHYEVFDDYAHHPTEIKTTLEAFKDKFPDRALICIFQPHQAERLKRLFPEFKKSFKAADALSLLPEYKVQGRDEKPSQFTAENLALAIKKSYPRKAVSFISDPKNFSRETVREAFLRSGSTNRKAVVVMMGAGNIVDYTPRLLD